MTNLEMQLLAASTNLKGVRMACGFPLARVARALGVQPFVIYQYETGRRTPNGQLGNRYMRIVQGMRNHAEIPETGCFEHLEGEELIA